MEFVKTFPHMKLPLPAVFVAILSCLLASCADTRHRLIVSAADQRMAVLEDERPIAFFRISTSKWGLSSQPGTNGTPLGRHEIAKKIGGGQPAGMAFKSRVATGEIVPVNAPGRDIIVSRILWLRGLEPWNQTTYGRYIYLHGTPEERNLGKPVSYGCVRMASTDIIWLYDVVGKGAKVDLVREPLEWHLARLNPQ
jgi:lipoprotein-anchoring transpeptidase ErfK/SrfK